MDRVSFVLANKADVREAATVKNALPGAVEAGISQHASDLYDEFVRSADAEQDPVKRASLAVVSLELCALKTQMNPPSVEEVKELMADLHKWNMPDMESMARIDPSEPQKRAALWSAKQEPQPPKDAAGGHTHASASAWVAWQVPQAVNCSPRVWHRPSGGVVSPPVHVEASVSEAQHSPQPANVLQGGQVPPTKGGGVCCGGAVTSPGGAVAGGVTPFGVGVTAGATGHKNGNHKHSGFSGTGAPGSGVPMGG
ncbi:hypothetical protein DIPPA_33298 [Diplonema papillatum]|nr:hypothetical protein DIPPA_33298 [Diplonema papillatum]